MEPTTLGKYQIRATLGRGAMGTVYDGWDPVITRRVAVKTVAMPKASDADETAALERFRREAQAAGRLTHPNIVGVFDYGETEHLAYIVMEYVEGGTLKAKLDAGERLAPANVMRLMHDVLAGLQYSHERGVVHRDIKPANIMLTPEGRAKIADFGIARIESSSMTQTGTVLGTPAYMSPEQFMGQTVDARTDIYSTGVLFYQLLTGDRPFEGSMSAIMHKALNTTPPRPSELAVTVPVSLDAVVTRAMARRPEDRFPSATAFAAAMDAAFAPGATAASTDATIIAGGAAPAAVPSLPSARRGGRGGRGGVLAAAAAAVVVVVAIGSGLYFAFAPGRKPTTIETSPVPKPVASAPAPTSAPAPAPSRQAVIAPPPPPIASPPVASPPVASSPPPPAPPPAAPEKLAAAPDPATLRAAIAAALAPVPCALVSFDPAGAAGPVALTGLAGSGAPEARLRSALREAAPDAATDWRVSTFDGPYCNAIDAIRPIAATFGAPASGFTLGLRDGKTHLYQRDKLIVDIAMPDFPAYLRVDYFQHDGTVWHMYPEPGTAPRTLPARARQSIGEPRAGFPGWEIDAPYGTDLVLSIAAASPLFAAGRTEFEKADAYLPALRAALADAARRHDRLAADALLLETSPR